VASFSGVFKQACARPTGSRVLNQPVFSRRVDQAPSAVLVLRRSVMRPALSSWPESIQPLIAFTDRPIGGAGRAAWTFSASSCSPATVTWLVLDELGLAIALGYSADDVVST